jgi:ankyrin repeat protein
MEHLPSDDTLHKAVSSGDVDALKLLIGNGFDVDQWQYEEFKSKSDLIPLTAIEKAVDMNNKAVLQVLLDVKQDVKNIKRICLCNAIRYSALIGNYECFQEILSHISDIDSSTINFSLVNSGIGGNIEIAKRLLELGADIDFENENCRTSIMYACMYGHLELVKFFVEKGANIELISQESPFASAIWFAKNYGHNEIYSYLLSTLDW